VVLEKDGEDQLHLSVKNKEVVHRIKVERNILQAIKRCMANWIGHILHRNCLLKHIINEKSGLKHLPSILYVPSTTTTVSSSSFPLFRI
jgi:hypothetical protein